MASKDDAVKEKLIVDARARDISHNVRCTDCGSQSIEDSQADIAILLRKVNPLLHSLQSPNQFLQIDLIKGALFGVVALSLENKSFKSWLIFWN